MAQVLRPKKATDNPTNISELNTGEVNVVSDLKPAATINNMSESSPSSIASNIMNRTVPSAEVHDQPTQPEISDALQKLLEMKLNKTLASAKASLEEKEPTILNKVGEVVLAKPNLGKEIRIPKPVEVETVPVINNQIANTIPVSTPPVIPSAAPVTPVTPVVATTNVVQTNNPQPVTTSSVSQEVPKKSLLDKLLGF